MIPKKYNRSYSCNAILPPNWQKLKAIIVNTGDNMKQ